MTKILNALSDSRLPALFEPGVVGVLPSDTIYGLVCRASDEVAVKHLYSLKNRENKPGTIIAASIEQLVDLGLKVRYLKAVEQFWPNAVSIVIPSYNLTYIHQGVGSVAVRIPKHSDLQRLLEQTGPLLTSSANHAGEEPAANEEEARAYFGDTVDFYVAGEDLSSQPPSTVIRIVDDAVEILREGAVKIDEETGKIL